MQNAKRMVLVDEKLLEYFQNKPDLSWKRPVEQSVKSSISKQMKSTLDDSVIPDDIKAKNYRQSLNRFLQSKRKLPDEPLLPTIDELLDIKPEEKKFEPKIDDVKPKQKKKRKKSQRVKKKPERYADLDWDKW